MITRQKLTSPDFDWQQLRQLAGEDRTFEYELLEMFVQDAQQSLKELEQAIATHSIQAIQDIAHSLRGASANVGASALAVAARQMEQVAQGGQLTEAPVLLQQIRAHCSHIQLHLNQADLKAKL